MSAKDTIVKVLEASRTTVRLEDTEIEVNPIVLEEDFEKVAQQIIDSLPRLDRDKVRSLIWKWREFCGALHPVTSKRCDKMTDQICSLVPEHKWVQTTDDRGNVIVPLGEVVATGEVEVYCDEYEGDVTRIGDTELYEHFWNHKGEKGTLIWVPDKEVE